MKKLLALAIFLRILLSAFYFHPDIKTYNFQSSFLKKGVFNIYNFLAENRKTLPLKEEFVYFPLTYLVLGGYQFIVSPFLGQGFEGWLANADSTTFPDDPSIFKYLLVLKIPYILLDVAMAFLLMKFFKGEKSKKKAFIIWLFNPFTPILIYVFANVDIFPVILTVISFLLFKREKPFLGSVFLGIASGFKLYPLLFVPFLFIFAKTLKEKILLSGLPLVIFGLICLPFFSEAFIRSALVSGLSTGILRSTLTPIAISLLAFYEALLDKKINIFNYWLSLFIIIFSFSLFHVQWLLWLAPFLIILVIRKTEFSGLIFFLSFLAFAIPVLYQDRFMTLGLLRAYSTLYDQLPTPYVVLQKLYDPDNLREVIHSVMAAGGMTLIYKMFRKEGYE